VASCGADGDLSGLFMLEGGFAHLNHGSYGATLRVAHDAAERWRALMEESPCRFLEVRCVGTASLAYRSSTETVTFWTGSARCSIY
jgi:hypothetical protein